MEWYHWYLVATAIGTPYSVMSLARSALVGDSKPIKGGEWIAVTLLAAVVWPGIVGHDICHRQEIKEQKRKLIYMRNAKLLTEQLANHKLAVQERVNRHRAQLKEFDSHFPGGRIEWPEQRAIGQNFGPTPSYLSAQDKFVAETARRRRNRVHWSGSGDHCLYLSMIEDSNEVPMLTWNMNVVTCDACRRYYKEV